MARPTKQGIDYFPIDVDLDQDDKLGMIIGEFGEKGERLWIKVLSWIYKHHGYYTEWNEGVQLKFLRRYSYCGFSMGLINEVVPRFIKWGLLDQSVFDTFHILTSVRIQKTWFDAARKRKDRIIDGRIWLLDVSGGVKAEETKEKAEETTQSKVKESKGKEMSDVPPPASFGSAILKNIEDLKADCLKDRVNFVEHVCRQHKITNYQVERALEEFNRHLLSISEGVKSVKDYRLHFQRWLAKQEMTAFRINPQEQQSTGNVADTLKSIGL